MLIAHISDLHIFADKPESSLVRRDAERVARKIIRDAAQIRPALDAVMLTGDLVDGGSAEDYDLLLSVLDPIDVPLFVIPGNHDKRENLRSAYSDRLPFNDGRYLNYAVECGPLRVLGLDSVIEGRIEGGLPLKHWTGWSSS